MKPITKNQAGEIRAFIRKHGDPKPRAPFAYIVGSVECLRHNIELALQRKGDSTAQRRQRRDELDRLKSALAGLSHDTRAIVSEWVGFAAMKVRNVHTWEHDGMDLDTITDAVDMAIQAEPKKRKARGVGHMAEVRRRFVCDAAALYLLAGFDAIQSSDTSPFMDWCGLMNDVCRLSLHEYGSFRRAVHDEIGKTDSARTAWTTSKMRWIARTFPT